MHRPSNKLSHVHLNLLDTVVIGGGMAKAGVGFSQILSLFFN